MSRSPPHRRRQAPAPDLVPRTRSLLEGPERSLAALVVVCALIVVVAYVGAEWTTIGQELDEGALEGHSLEDPDARDTTDRLLRTLTSSSLALVGLALAAIVAILGANITTQVLKVGLPRPNLLGPDGVAFGRSLPSGHATAAMSLAIALALVLPARFRALGVLPLLAWALFVGVGTLATGWHRPSDVIAAYALTIGWGALVAIVVVRRRHRSVAEPPTAGGALGAVSPLMLAVGMVALAVGFVGAAVAALVIHVDGISTVDTHTEFVLATAAIIGSGLLLMASLLLALRGAAGFHGAARTASRA